MEPFVLDGATPSSSLDRVFAKASHAFFEVLNRYTLADLARNPEFLGTPIVASPVS